MDAGKVKAENQSPTAHKISKKLWFYALSACFCAVFVVSWLYDLFIHGIEPHFRDSLEDAVFTTLRTGLIFWLLHFLSNRKAKKKLENIKE
jgi:hypothetical protein